MERIRHTVSNTEHLQCKYQITAPLIFFYYYMLSPQYVTFNLALDIVNHIYIPRCVIYPGQWFSNFRRHETHLKVLLKLRLLGPTHKVCFCRFGVSTRMCFSTSCQSMLLVRGPHFENQWPTVISSYIKFQKFQCPIITWI